MNENFTVERTIEEGIIVLAVTYDPGFFLRQGARQTASQELIKQYCTLLESQEKELIVKSCIVDIRTGDIGSSLLRGLFELYQEVVGKEGSVLG